VDTRLGYGYGTKYSDFDPRAGQESFIHGWAHTAYYSRTYRGSSRLEVFTTVTMKNGVFWDVNAVWLL
jgi:hypothetical protein